MTLDRARREAGVPRAPEPLLRSTFEPGGLPTGLVVRERLLDALSCGVEQRPLTLLSAPAGAGKTVLAANWAAGNSRRWPIAWLTVDDACNQTGPFWRCLIEALVRAGLGLGELQMPAVGEAVPRSSLMRLAAALLGLDGPVVVVLDGSDRSLSAESLAALDFLIRHAHPRFRLVMCGRADPMLPLHRYRLVDAMTELRYDDLAFTVAEAQQLFAGCDVPIPAEAARMLTELTEGWAAGLRLAAASLEQGADPDTLLDSLVRDDGSVAEYLFAEVLDAQSPHVRRLLLRTSVCEQLWPDLVNTLTGRQDARHVLAELVTANAFVQRSGNPAGTYRVHPLFRELLRAQLSYESADEVAALHRRCAEWFAAAGEPVLAAGHAIAGEDAAHAAAILVESGAAAALLAQENSPFAPAALSLPPALPGDDGALLRAALALRSGGATSGADAARLDTIVAESSDAEVADQSGPSRALRTSAAVVQAAACAAGATTATDSERATHLADRAGRHLAELPGPEAAGEVLTRTELSAIAQLAAAAATMMCAGPQPSRDGWNTALAAGTAAGSSRLRRSCLAGLALAEALAGRLRHAVELGEAAEEIADELSVARGARPAAAPLAIAWAKCEQLQFMDARQWARLAGKSAPDQLGALCDSVGAMLQARLLRSRQDIDAAVALLEPSRAAVGTPSWLRERQLVELAALELARSRPDEAMAHVDAMPDPHSARAGIARSKAAALGTRSKYKVRDAQVDAADALDLRVDASLQQASVALMHGEIATVVTAVRQAWELAKPECMRRPFLESSPELRRQVRAQPALRAVSEWLSPSAPVVKPARVHARHAPGPATSVPEQVDAAALTDREIEVLRLLSQLLSTEEIGAAMFVSVNTVRTHIRSILRKLAVTRRNEAVRRARELDLV
jgi:LuxR family maltose regulon positive regulatory protein